MIKWLCKQHFIEIILLLKESPKSFNELQKILNAYPDTLNRRLKEMSEMGITIQIKDDKVKYKLTEKGIEVATILDELIEILKKLELVLTE